MQVKLVQGPPGTGKSSTLTRLLSVLGCSGSRTLLCAPTNVAVCVVAARYLQLVAPGDGGAAQGGAAAGAGAGSGGQHASQAMQYGQHVLRDGAQLRQAGASQEVLLSGDLLLVGNSDRIDSKGPLGRLYLPCRVDRLMQAVRGWESAVQRLEVALRQPVLACRSE
jgi:hypothetical protein